MCLYQFNIEKDLWVFQVFQVFLEFADTADEFIKLFSLKLI